MLECVEEAGTILNWRDTRTHSNNNNNTTNAVVTCTNKNDKETKQLYLRKINTQSDNVSNTTSSSTSTCMSSSSLSLSHSNERNAKNCTFMDTWMGEIVRLLRLNRKDRWQEIKQNTNHVHYRLLVKMTQLKKILYASTKLQQQSLMDMDRHLIRFSIDNSCVNPQQEVVYLFSINPRDKVALSLLLQTIAYMFCKQNTKRGEGAQTVQECYEWATNPTNQVHILDMGSPPVRYAMILPTPIIEIYNESMKHVFQEGIIHRDDYKWESHGIVNFQTLELVPEHTTPY